MEKLADYILREKIHETEKIEKMKINL